MMRSPSAFFLVSLLFVFAEFGDARKDPAEDYWTSTMKGEPMPKVIEELVHGVHNPNHEESLNKDKKKWDPSSETTINMAHFQRDFDTKPNLIIYHSHNMGHHETHDQSEGKKSLVKSVKGWWGRGF